MLDEVVVTSDYRVTHTSNYDAAKQEGTILEQRACALLSEGDVTPDCYVIKTHDSTTVGVAIGGQADIAKQGEFAASIATDIAARYQELCQ